jgi:hypothetical protein
MSTLVLKIIALIAMTIDHTGKVLLTNSDLCNIIGRVSFPIFAFLLVEGYHRTKSVKKYLLRLFVVAVISEFAFYNLFGGLNTIFTLIVGLLCIIVYDKEEDKAICFTVILTIAVLAILFALDYGAFGILSILLFHIYRKNKLKRSLFFIILVLIHYSIFILSTNDFNYLYPMYMSIASLFLINRYEDKKCPKLKYFFYIYYPLHLYILWGIQLLIK